MNKLLKYVQNNQNLWLFILTILILTTLIYSYAGIMQINEMQEQNGMENYPYLNSYYYHYPRWAYSSKWYWYKPWYWGRPRVYYRYPRRHHRYMF